MLISNLIFIGKNNWMLGNSSKDKSLKSNSSTEITIWKKFIENYYKIFLFTYS